MTECLRYGTTEEIERFGNAYICADCTPGDDDSTRSERFDTTGEHENPIDVSDVTDAVCSFEQPDGGQENVTDVVFIARPSPPQE